MCGALLDVGSSRLCNGKPQWVIRHIVEFFAGVPHVMLESCSQDLQLQSLRCSSSNRSVQVVEHVTDDIHLYTFSDCAHDRWCSTAGPAQISQLGAAIQLTLRPFACLPRYPDEIQATKRQWIVEQNPASIAWVPTIANFMAVQNTNRHRSTCVTIYAYQRGQILPEQAGGYGN